MTSNILCAFKYPTVDSFKIVVTDLLKHMNQKVFLHILKKTSSSFTIVNDSGFENVNTM